MLKKYTLPVLLTFFLVSLPFWSDVNRLIPERTYDELPSDAIPLPFVFSDEIALVGWRIFDEEWSSPQNAWGDVGMKYVVELFWQRRKPLSQDLAFYVAYVQNGERLLGIDQQLGNISFPPLPTSRWDDKIYGEIVGFDLGDVGQLQSGEITVGVFGGDKTGTIINRRVTIPTDMPFVTLQKFALYRQPSETIDTSQIMRLFTHDSEQIALMNFDMPTSAGRGETINLSMEWVALSEIMHNYNLFVHVVDDNGILVAQTDISPIPTLFTDNWKPYFRLSATIPLTLPTDSGTYTLYMGLFDVLAQNRMITDAPDNRPQIGTIRVQ